MSVLSKSQTIAMTFCSKGAAFIKPSLCNEIVLGVNRRAVIMHFIVKSRSFRIAGSADDSYRFSTADRSPLADERPGKVRIKSFNMTGVRYLKRKSEPALLRDLGDRTRSGSDHRIALLREEVNHEMRKRALREMIAEKTEMPRDRIMIPQRMENRYPRCERGIRREGIPQGAVRRIRDRERFRRRPGRPVLRPAGQLARILGPRAIQRKGNRRQFLFRRFRGAVGFRDMPPEFMILAVKCDDLPVHQMIP